MTGKSTRPRRTSGTKRILAVALALLMVMSVAVPALAASNGSQTAGEVSFSAQEPDKTIDDLRAEPVRPDRNESTSADTTMQTTNVTLVTGQTVTVLQQGNRTNYRVHADEPVHQVETPQGTYVFPASVDLSKFDPALFNVDLLLEQQLNDSETDSVPVIVKLADDEDDEKHSTLSTNDGDRTRDGESDRRSPRRTREELNETKGLTADQTLESVGAVAGHVEKARGLTVAETLQSNADVEKVYLDAKVRPALDDVQDVTNAGQAREQYGVNGSNVTVAVLDTGVNESHPDLQGRVGEQKDFTGEGTTDDLRGHGTHVAGIVAGDGNASDGQYVGVAPEAEIMNLRVLNSEGWGNRSDIVEAIEYASKNGADVISMSLGGPPSASDPYRAAIKNATERGVPVVVSAGNDGDSYETIGSPGVVPEAITVGASNDYDYVTPFSSRGPTSINRYVKPDLVAPGKAVYSANASSGGYVAYSGTSMSAPAVSGAAALLLEENPDWSPTQVRSALVTTTDPLNESYDVYTQGSGRLNATGALESNLTFENSTTNFGVFESDTEATRIVTITNRGSTDRTLTVNATATNIDDGAEGNVTANVSEVTVPAGETSQVALTVNTTDAGGIYSGTVKFDGGNYTTIFGYVRASQLTVEKVGVGDVSDDLVYVFADDTGDIVSVDYLGEDGKVTEAVTAGNYTIMTAGLDETTDNETVFMLDSVEVRGGTSVTLNENETVRYDLATANVTDEHGPLVNLTAFGQMHDVIGGHNYSWTVGEYFADRGTVRFSNGSYNASVSHLLAPEKHYGDDPEYHLDSPVAYALTYPTAGVDGSRTFEVNDTTLAATDYTYYRNEPGESYWVYPWVRHDRWQQTTWYYGSVPYTGMPLGSWNTRDRSAQTIYHTPATETYNRSFVLDAYEGEYFDGWMLFQPEWTTHQQGERTATSINEHPLKGQRLNWTLDPNAGTNFSVEAWFMADQRPGQHVYDYYSWNEYWVYRNDTLVYYDEPWSDWFDAEYVNDTTLPPNTTYRIEMRGDNEYGKLSTDVYTSYYGEYQPDTDNVPPEIESIDAPERTVYNAIPEGDATVTVNVSDNDRSNVTLNVAYAPQWVDEQPYDSTSMLNDGWSKATVTEDGPGNFSATLDTSGWSGKTIHLAVTAKDGDGNVVDVYTYDALNVRDLTPPELDLAATPDEHVSTRNATTITVDSTDAHPGSTVVEVTNASGGLLATYDVTEEVTDGPTTVEWNATNASDEPVTSGPYNVTIWSVDALGNENQTTATVTVDHTDPTVAVTALDANETARTAPNGRTVYTNGMVSVNASADGTPGDAKAVGVRFDADFTNFRSETFAASQHATNWSTTADLSNLTDDGNYSVNVTAVDFGLNENATTADATVVLDRTDPELAATVSQLNSTNGSVNVTTNEPLADDPSIEVTGPDDTAQDVTVVESGDTWWNATFNLSKENGQYDVTVTGTDLAGNVDTDAATANISTVETTNNTTTVIMEPSGLFVNFTTNQSVNDTIVMTESDTPLAPLTKGNAGVSFLNAKLGEYLDENLSYAVIGIPVENDLPDNVENPEDVKIRYYNESATGQDKWEEIDTTVENRTIDGTERTYWIATVEHFSTYGAVADDTDAPTLESSVPGDDLSPETTAAEVRFNYTDDLSGVNVSAVELTFDDEDVTNSASTSITSQLATYNATGLSVGTYTAEVYLEDEAGHPATYDLTFTIPQADDGDDGSNGGGGGGGGGGSVPPPSILKDVTALSDGGVEVRLRNGIEGRTPSLYFDGIDAGGVTFDRLRVSYAYDLQEFTFQMHPSADAPAGASALDTAEPLGYLDVEREVQNAYFESVSLRFEVPKSALPEGATLDDVALYRYDGGSWTEIDTTRQGTTFEATADGFATFAVGVDTAASEEPTTETPTETPDGTSTPDESTETTPEDGQPGFGFAIGLLALLGAALLARRL